MRFQYESGNGYLRVVVDGPFDPGEARRGLGDLLREAQTRAADRILIDARGISSPVSISDRYDLATQLASAGSRQLRVAFLVAADNMFTKTLEDTATNRGMSVRTTASEQEALDYLR